MSLEYQDLWVGEQWVGPTISLTLVIHHVLAFGCWSTKRQKEMLSFTWRVLCIVDCPGMCKGLSLVHLLGSSNFQWLEGCP